MEATKVIIKPLITEKSTHQANARNTYSFHVNPKADKLAIKAAIEELYKVKVADVRTLVRKGKARRTKTGYAFGSDVKRAIVKLAEDSKIELF
jgi:large subunit ribosomal protein L23